MDKMKMSLKGGAEDVGGVQCSPANDSQQVKLLFSPKNVKHCSNDAQQVKLFNFHQKI